MGRRGKQLNQKLSWLSSVNIPSTNAFEFSFPRYPEGQELNKLNSIRLKN